MKFILSLFLIVNFNIYPIKECKIIEYTKYNMNERNISIDDSTSNANDLISCDYWNLDSVKLINIFKNSGKIHPYDANYFFDYLDCGYEGIVALENIPFKFRLNAGGVISMKQYKDSTAEIFYMICYHEEFKNYFISGMSKYDEDGTPYDINELDLLIENK